LVEQERARPDVTGFSVYNTLVSPLGLLMRPSAPLIHPRTEVHFDGGGRGMALVHVDTDIGGDTDDLCTTAMLLG
jgi:hypothetical protein